MYNLLNIYYMTLTQLKRLKNKISDKLELLGSALVLELCNDILTFKSVNLLKKEYENSLLRIRKEEQIQTKQTDLEDLIQEIKTEQNESRL